MNKLYPVEDFTQDYAFVYANTEELRRHSYKIRYQKHQQNSEFLTSDRTNMGIDQYDAHSHHILLQHKTSKVFVAAIRIIEPPHNQPEKLLPFEEKNHDIMAPGINIDTLPRRSFSEISDLCIAPDFKSNKAPAEKGPYTQIEHNCPVQDADQTAANIDHDMTAGLYLAAISLARLMFHEYVFAELPNDVCDKFKLQRLSFEQTATLSGSQDENVLFVLDLETGISTSSPLYELYQYILNEIAHQLNNPVVQDNEPDAMQSA